MARAIAPPSTEQNVMITAGDFSGLGAQLAATTNKSTAWTFVKLCSAVLDIMGVK